MKERVHQLEREVKVVCREKEQMRQEVEVSGRELEERGSRVKDMEEKVGVVVGRIEMMAKDN